MKTISKTIVSKTWESPLAWAVDHYDKIEGYITYKFYFDLKEGLRFSCTVPNASFCTRSPIKCLIQAIEYNSVGMGKYIRLKELTRKQKLWQQLDPTVYKSHPKHKKVTE